MPMLIYRMNHPTNKKKRLTFNGENKTLVLICNSLLVNLAPSIYNLVVMEIVRWNDVIRNIYVGSNPLAAS